MKYNPILRSKRLNAAGFTLIEISLVIALLLGLIAVVFLGLGTYREGADAANCRMQLAAVQKAVRSWANMNTLKIGDPVPEDGVFGAGLAMQNAPECPAGGTYQWETTIPTIGTPFGNCDIEGPPAHILDPETDTKLADW